MTTITPFDIILQRAIKRKGNRESLNQRLTPIMPQATLAKQADRYFLSYMARCVFNAGFVWKIVEHKWPEFEKAFLKFEPDLLLRLSEEQWEAFVSNEKIIRHYKKIYSIRDNAQFIYDINFEHSSFGEFFSRWPVTDQIGLLALLKHRGSRLGGMTGQYLLRFCGKDGFILNRDVVRCLQEAGLDIKNTPSSKRDLAKTQAAFNQWHQETNLPYTHLSQIAAFSVGENHR